MKILNSKGSSIDPFGIPAATAFLVLALLLIVYNFLDNCILKLRPSLRNRIWPTSLAKWLSVRLRTKWLWVRVQLQSIKLQISRLL